MKKVIITVVSLFMLAGASTLRATDTGVPSECEDVMLQAFYWNSYNTNGKYGCTKWNYLLSDTAAINANFDLVWFPPSAQSTGGVGYYHTCLSDQGNTTATAWGPKAKLTQLIAALHAGNTKVIADIVINHRGNKSSWVDFYADNFGDYGTFQLTQEHICYGDEVFTDPSSSYYGATPRGAADTGINDSGCRDLDHTNEYVQNWAKAYVQWMIDVMKYDGFRYDMTLGYHGSYLGMYNEASNPYLSVSELWSDVATQINHLKATNYNTMIFDFPLKFTLNDKIGGTTGAYGGLRNPSESLRGKGYAKYSVTFIDNHDTFERSDNQSSEFISYNADLQNAANKNKILQAYAYILMMPGVPCVSWPHWKSYQTEINQLIAIRKLAGIHSESVVSDETGAQHKYSAMIQGHRGNVIVRLGKKRDTTMPEGYELALEGGDAGDYTIFICQNSQGIENVSDLKQGEKFVKDGKLFIRVGEKIYDAQGRLIKK